MACGTPVAAYPVEGPLEVVGTPAQGGVLHEDLAAAWYKALVTPRHEARARALDFSWAHASRLFIGHLVPAVAKAAGEPIWTKPATVTELSSNN